MLAESIHPSFITDENGTKKSVVLSIQEYNDLMEEFQDFAIIAERKNEEAVSHEDVVKGLKADGLL